MRSRWAGVNGVWPVALAIAIRVGIWVVLPDERFASDEDSYYQTGMSLLQRGEQDLFWPPVTGWLIAFWGWILQTTEVKWIRIAWIAMDIGCVVAVRALALRVASVLWPADAAHARRFAMVATLAYALYLPAIAFAQFTTSETPALLIVLTTLVILTRPALSWKSLAGGGVLIGVLAVTRPSLLPLLVFLPAALLLYRHAQITMRLALLFVAAGAAVIGGVVLRNVWIAGEATIARNSAYNLYIGNRDLYAEDLDLFHPVATAGQIEFRRQFWSGELAYPTESPEVLQREALAWIAEHPEVFARRALGRLARVFAPKTDVLELVGGERRAGIFSPRALLLLGIANAQWVVVLFAGIIGLAGLWRLHPPTGALLLATVLGSLPLCLIAISKPRYAFTFEPLLLIGAVLVVMARHDVLEALRARDRWIVAGCLLFLVWGWTAWLIFAITSRVGLAGAS